MSAAAPDLPHPVPPQAYMTWKENWVFCALDPAAGVASVFHFSLRPGLGEGVFSAKIAVAAGRGGEPGGGGGGDAGGGTGPGEGVPAALEVRDVERAAISGSPPAPAGAGRGVTAGGERLAFSVLSPGERFALRYRGESAEADIEYCGRFPIFDYEEGPLAPGRSDLGDIGRRVFPFHHHEQALTFSGVLRLLSGPRAGTELQLSGTANRDHSWGWRDDLGFRYHHWLCASFDDCYVGGALMEEVHYPDGPKHGGFVAAETATVPVTSVEPPATGWPRPGALLPALRGDATYRLTLADGSGVAVTVHLDRCLAALRLDARSPDRTSAYQDTLSFCPMTLHGGAGRPGTGEGWGVLEIGNALQGADLVEASRRRPPA